MVEEAIKKFSLPDGFSLKTSARKAASSSVLHKYGIVAESTTKTLFFCLAHPNCIDAKTSISLSGGKSGNGTKHLRDKHKIVSAKTQAAFDNESNKQENMNSFMSSELYLQDSKFGIRILEAMKFTENLWPFNCISSTSYQLDMRLSKKIPMSVSILKHTFCEVYAAFVRYLSMLFLGQFIYLMVDLWTDKITKRKFLGVRLSFTDLNFTFHSHLIAVREFTLTSEQSRNKKWSEMLLCHLQGILKEFGVTWPQVIGATSDAGSDVKKILQSKFGNMWEWCVSHLLHRMAKQTSKLESIQSLLKKLRDVFQFVSKNRTNWILFKGTLKKK